MIDTFSRNMPENLDPSTIIYFALQLTPAKGTLDKFSVEFLLYETEEALLAAGHSRVFFKGTDIEFQRHLADLAMDAGRDLEII